jgi:hypothetical protein
VAWSRRFRIWCGFWKIKNEGSGFDMCGAGCISIDEARND